MTFPVGVGGAGSLTVVLEDTMGTFVAPGDGVAFAIPIKDESLEYTEARYISSQIREAVIPSQVSQGYYHIEGDVVLEADTTFLPLLLSCSRHKVVKSTNGSGFTYEYTPSTDPTATNGGAVDTPRTASISVIRNLVGFGYFGCVVSQFMFEITDGVLMLTAHIIGLGEQAPGSFGPSEWDDALLLGAAAHSIYTADGDADAGTPTFTSNSTSFSTFQVTLNHNAEAVPRIQPSRAAAFVRYAQTEIGATCDLDFADRDEYDAYVATDHKAVRLESIGDGGSFAASNDAVRIDINNAIYESYPIHLTGMADIVQGAGVNYMGLAPASGDAYKVTIQSLTDIDGIVS